MDKKILYIDMDGVLVNFKSAVDKLDEETKKQYEPRFYEVPGLFLKMEPMEGAVEAFHQLSEVYDTYILSTAPWSNPSAWTDKLIWVKEHLGDESAAHKRLILTHHKNLNRGDILIDDNDKKCGIDKFQGEHIHFGQERFPDWKSVLDYLL